MKARAGYQYYGSGAYIENTISIKTLEIKECIVTRK